MADRRTSGQMEILEAHLIYTNTPYQRYINLVGMDEIEVYDDNGNYLWDVVCGKYSYGGNLGLLEAAGEIVRDLDDDVEGYLTANEIIKRLKEGA